MSCTVGPDIQKFVILNPLTTDAGYDPPAALWGQNPMQNPVGLVIRTSSIIEFSSTYPLEEIPETRLLVKRWANDAL